MENALLNVSNLSVTLNQHKILVDINFSLGQDETVAIIGPNGAGKTVLFKALLGLLPYEGEIKWKKGTKIGYVPQKLSIENDLPLTVREFFNFKSNNKSEVNGALSSVGFTDKNVILNQKIGVLSGGQLQRVLIAWALLGKPDVLLFDEPTTGIDLSTEETIYSLLHKLQAKENLTILLISHELQVVYHYASKIICLNKEQVCYGPPRSVLDKEGLQKIFGSEVGVYQHHDHHEHN